MPQKTISVDLEAYRTLRSARQSKHESFSAVIKRAIERPPAGTFPDLLEQLKEFEGTGVFTPAERAEFRRRQRQSLRSRARVTRAGLPLKVLRY